MPIDHLLEFNDLMPDRLEMELIKKGDLPLSLLGLKKMRPDLEMSKEAIKSLFHRGDADEPKSLILMLPDLVQTTTQLATFKAGDKRKTPHQHLFLQKDCSGPLTVSLYTAWTKAEILSHLTSGKGSGNISDLSWSISMGLKLKEG